MDSSLKTLNKLASIVSITLFLMSNLIIPTVSRIFPLSTNHNEMFIYVPMKIGNVVQYLIFDTGSTLTWVQCRPCDPCIDQDPAIPQYYADPEKILPWLDSRCPSEEYRTFFDNEGFCAYEVSYADGTRTQGILGVETFHVGPEDMLINFGCSSSISPSSTFGNSSKISGILGMSKGPYSFISQTRDLYGGTFSFCFAPDSGTSKFARSFVRLGRELMVSSNANALDMIEGRIEQPFLYDVNLDRMYFGDNEINVAPGTFDGGCVLDTGSAVTHLAENAYNVLVKLMDEFFIYGHKFVRDPNTTSVCYTNFDFKPVDVPPVWLKFKGISGRDAWMVWGEKQLFEGESDGYHRCLQIFPSSDRWSTIGFFQMAHTHFTFDPEGKQIYFMENAACEYII